MKWNYLKSVLKKECIQIIRDKNLKPEHWADLRAKTLKKKLIKLILQ
jgi:hypothetical protein